MKDSSTITTIEQAREERRVWADRLDRDLRKHNKFSERVSQDRSFIAHYDAMITRLSYPTEPAEGKVVRFQKRYLGRPLIYSFAAVRGGDRWWVTGDHPQTRHGLTWIQLIDFVRSGNTLLPEDPKLMVDEDSANVVPF